MIIILALWKFIQSARVRTVNVYTISGVYSVFCVHAFCVALVEFAHAFFISTPICLLSDTFLFAHKHLPSSHSSPTKTSQQRHNTKPLFFDALRKPPAQNTHACKFPDNITCAGALPLIAPLILWHHTANKKNNENFMYTLIVRERQNLSDYVRQAPTAPLYILALRAAVERVRGFSGIAHKSIFNNYLLPTTDDYSWFYRELYATGRKTKSACCGW